LATFLATKAKGQDQQKSVDSLHLFKVKDAFTRSIHILVMSQRTKDNCHQPQKILSFFYCILSGVKHELAHDGGSNLVSCDCLAEVI